MRYRRLGGSGLLVSELCLGTNTFGGRGPVWERLGALDQAQANAVIKAAIDAGINFIDTADVYGAGESEDHVGRSLRDLGIPRSDLIIATKTGGRMGTTVNDQGQSRHHLLSAVEASLRRLHTDYLDVHMIHFPDPATPLEETLRALDDLVRAGKIRYLGCSNFHAWQVMKAAGISERESLERFQIMETHWSAATRDMEREVVPMSLDCGLGILAYGALLGGLLTGKFSRDGGGEGQGRTGGKVPPGVDRGKVFDVVDALINVAKRHKVAVSQVALAWLLKQPVVTSALFGARNPEQVNDNVGATEVDLSADDIAKINEAGQPVEPYDGIMQTKMAMAERKPYAG